MYKGKRTGDDIVDEHNTMGILKGCIKIYQWPPMENIPEFTPCGYDAHQGVFQNWPQNDPLPFVLRIYCIKGDKLRPKDINSNSDAYIKIKMGKQIVENRNEYIPNQYDPVFGR